MVKFVLIFFQIKKVISRVLLLRRLQRIQFLANGLSLDLHMMITLIPIREVLMFSGVMAQHGLNSQNCMPVTVQPVIILVSQFQYQVIMP
jgi:hypothetical protein